MTTIPGAFGGGSDLERLKAVLAGWRTSLVDLSGRNRLLNFSLFPVELVRTSTRQVRLQANGDEDPQLNPALPTKLEQFGIDWTPVAETDCRDVTAVANAVRGAVAGKSHWEVGEAGGLEAGRHGELLDQAGQVPCWKRTVRPAPGGRC